MCAASRKNHIVHRPPRFTGRAGRCRSIPLDQARGFPFFVEQGQHPVQSVPPVHCRSGPLAVIVRASRACVWTGDGRAGQGDAGRGGVPFTAPRPPWTGARRDSAGGVRSCPDFLFSPGPETQPDGPGNGSSERRREGPAPGRAGRFCAAAQQIFGEPIFHPDVRIDMEIQGITMPGP